ncbi:2'-5' RNA ligase family protein [Niabella ginsengisoli]|uniref:2'-5' RNA ligase family protein n=1 Tax=Niabella ginsengisoli TaxID=522298 RepID=A0ABS9SRB7_9BACT|nr:2'-5' RNA ligase family protein [Niabella ginsengisoli]
MREVKQTFYDKYKAPEALKGKPHLTLVKYAQYTSFESRICQRIRNVAIQMSPIAIDLNDYGSFPSHTIFINVVSKTAIQTLVKNIRTQLQSHMKLDKDNKPHFILEPHITVARRLKPWQYEQGWLEYSNKSFSGRFIASSMILLRKEEDAKRYDLVERFEFQNLNIHASQSALF